MFCFTKDFANPYLWAAYADSHAGACLIFERELLKGLGSPEWPDGVGMEDVAYAMTKPEIEFFSNVPKLTVSEYDNLFTSPNGRISPRRPYAPGDDVAIHEAVAGQLEFARANLLTKQKWWAAEQEVRMFRVFHILEDLNGDPLGHTVQYPIQALKGIIFGDRMTGESRQAVVDVILSKHYVSPMREDFAFFEAQMRPDGSIHKIYDNFYLDWRRLFSYPRKN